MCLGPEKTLLSGRVRIFNDAPDGSRRVVSRRISQALRAFNSAHYTVTEIREIKPCLAPGGHVPPQGILDLVTIVESAAFTAYMKQQPYFETRIGQCDTHAFICGFLLRQGNIELINIADGPHRVVVIRISQER